MKSLFGKNVAIVALSALQFTAMNVPASAATGQCLSETEAAAEKVRRLKTTIMVGSLQCSSTPHLRISENYNAFVNLHGSTVQSHDRTLSAYFKRAFGAGHRKAMDRHMTSTANKVASQSYKTTGFCEKIAALATASLAPSPAQLLSVANGNMIAPARLPACSAPVIRAAQQLPQ